MAANQLRAMHGRISFNDGADDNIVDAQGVDSVRELGCLNEDDVSNLCRTICCPGGHVANPAFVAGAAAGAAAAAAVPARISHTGIMVSQRTETNLKLASFTVRHHCCISRAMNIAGTNPTSIRRLRDLKIKEDSKGKDQPSAPNDQPEKLAKDHRRFSRLFQQRPWRNEGSFSLRHP